MAESREAAGVFLYRMDGDTVRWLLMRNVAWGEWGVPKGHADEGDTDCLATAMRELHEETGLRDVLIHAAFRHEMVYMATRKRGGDAYRKRVTYLLGRMEHGEVQLSPEHDALAWLTLPEALERLPHEALKQALGAAAAHLEGWRQQVPRL